MMCLLTETNMLCYVKSAPSLFLLGYILSVIDRKEGIEVCCSKG